MTCPNDPLQNDPLSRAQHGRAGATLLGATLLGVSFAGLTLALVAPDHLSSRVPAKPTSPPRPAIAPLDKEVAENIVNMIEEGRQTFRYDTFGDEDFWGGQLRLHEAVGQLGPAAALRLGLKVDALSLPPDIVQGIVSGQVNLEDPKATLLLLQHNAVVGVTGFFDHRDRLVSIGIQCAICHSTVDDSVAPGIGKRLDGWANRDLDIGAIAAQAPDLSPVAALLNVSEDTVRTVLQSWGPGKFDAELLLDGKATGPEGSAATLIPPAFGLAGINLHTWTGWGSVTHWNAFVANIEMHGKGTFFDPRLNDPVRFPIAAQAGFANIRQARPEEDLITSKLAALHLYQLALPAPKPPPGSFDPEAALRGKDVFLNVANCSTCHVEPLFSEPGWNMHTAEEIGIDDFQSSRAPDEHYRTAPLRGLWTHQKGGFYHDGRFANLEEVVEHYDETFGLGLTGGQKDDLVQYLLSL